MKYFAGLDVSMEETAICVIDGTGRIVQEARAGERASSAFGSVAESRSAFGANRA